MKIGFLLRNFDLITYCEKKNSFSDRENLFIFEAEAENLQIFEITRTISSNSERSVQFLKQNTFKIVTVGLSDLNTLEQLECLKKSLELEKIIYKKSFKKSLELLLFYCIF